VKGKIRGEKMKKIWLAIAAVVALLGILALAGCGVEGNPGNVSVNLGQQTGMWVSGEGKVTVTPDLAILSLGVQSQEITVADAQAKASDAMDKLVKALKDQGVADKDIQTQYFNITQVYRWDNDKQTQVVIGYQVTNTVTVKVRQVENAGKIIDAVVAAGGDLTRVNGITFTVENPTNYHNDARAKAIADAKAKAEQMAKESGIKLGKITYITESSYNFQPIYRAYDSYASGAPAPATTTPVSAGELDITTTVQISYQLD